MATKQTTKANTGNKAQDTAMQEKQDQSLAAFEDMENDAGEGFENADSESYAIPFLRVLQDLSPQVKKQRSEFIKGAEPGMILNTVTEQVFPADANEEDSGLIVIPCYYRRAFIEWIPRDQGGGFVAEHPPGAEKGLERDGGKFITKDGNELADTRYHYVLVVQNDGSYEPALITMTSTQITKSKRWMSTLNNVKTKTKSGKTVTPPMFMHKCRLQTKPESNDQGDWYGWHIVREGMLTADDMELYEAAKSFKDAVKTGNVRETEPDTDIPQTDDTAF